MYVYIYVIYFIHDQHIQHTTERNTKVFAHYAAKSIIGKMNHLWMSFIKYLKKTNALGAQIPNF